MKALAKFTGRSLGLLALAAGGLLMGRANAQITQNLGTLAAGESVTITFEVTIDSPLTAGVTQIAAQGTVSGSNFAIVNTDDPETATANDPTVTPLAQDFDFGDAPDPTYPTLQAHGGARHFMPAGGATIFLGAAAPDADSDGQPDPAAAGDDTNGADDEDGVVLPAFPQSGQTQSITVTSSGPGFLNAWIDFNRDGDWSDAGEQVFTDQPVGAGINLLSVTVPTLSGGGASFARFRLTSYNSGGALSFAGDATDGEVEDYAVTLNLPPVAGADTIERFATQDVKVKVATLLANDTDGDGDTLSIIALASPSPGGATVTRDNEWIYYTPLPGFTSADSFTYTASDGHGATVTGTVTVTVRADNEPTQNIGSIQDLGGGTFRITLNGVPGRAYTIQYTETLNPPNTIWTTLGTATADAVGVIIYDDAAGSVSRFYRSAYP